jgi:hypothetical protein
MSTVGGGLGRGPVARSFIAAHASTRLAVGPKGWKPTICTMRHGAGQLMTAWPDCGRCDRLGCCCRTTHRLTCGDSARSGRAGQGREIQRGGSPPRPLHCQPLSARSSMDRASDYGSEGWGFESLRAHCYFPLFAAQAGRRLRRPICSPEFACPAGRGQRPVTAIRGSNTVLS